MRSAANRFVAPQFTKTIAASDAGISARRARTQKARESAWLGVPAQHQRGYDGGSDANDGKIARDPGRRVRPNEPSSDRAMKADGPFKWGAPFPDEIVAWIPLPSGSRFIRACASSLARFTASSESRVISSSECFEPRASSSIAVAVAISSWKIHCGKVALGTQHRIDEADALD